MKTTVNLTLLSLPQVAERLGISRQAVHLAVKEGRLKAREMRLGNRKFFLVAPSDADKYAATREERNG
jgi:biotin operon repressor